MLPNNIYRLDGCQPTQHFILTCYFFLQVDTLFEAMNHVTVADRPPSIFQCQIKLFNQWYNDWTPHHRQLLYANLTQTDADFMVKLNETIFQQSTRIS